MYIYSGQSDERKLNCSEHALSDVTKAGRGYLPK